VLPVCWEDMSAYVASTVDVVNCNDCLTSKDIIIILLHLSSQIIIPAQVEYAMRQVYMLVNLCETQGMDLNT